jgi:hypothetical protein
MDRGQQIFNYAERFELDNGIAIAFFACGYRIENIVSMRTDTMVDEAISTLEAAVRK